MDLYINLLDLEKKSDEKYKFQNACISLKILEAGKLYIKIKKKNTDHLNFWNMWNR